MRNEIRNIEIRMNSIEFVRAYRMVINCVKKCVTHEFARKKGICHLAYAAADDDLISEQNEIRVFVKRQFFVSNKKILQYFSFTDL